MDIEGIPLESLRTLSRDEQNALLNFGTPVTFTMGTAIVLAEFNRSGNELIVNLAHIDGGGEGVLLSLWKAVETYATDRAYYGVQWNVHALTCAKPNPRLQRFLRRQGFGELDHQLYGRIFACRRNLIEETSLQPDRSDD